MTALNVAKEVAAMEGMTARELHEKFAKVFGEPSRSNNRVWLVKRIAWRMQANEEGTLSERARKRAMELANDADLRMKAPAPKLPPRSASRKARRAMATRHDKRVPLPGKIITRAYKGRTLRVTVLPEGFEFDGDVYRSLSAVAKTITGSHTNGFLFFHLNGKGGHK